MARAGSGQGAQQQAGAQNKVQNKYAGFPRGATLPTAGETVDVASLTPETFWERYVCPRKPVIITGQLPDATWKASQLWTDEYLTHKAGTAVLEVEERKSSAEGYGKGIKVQMTFGECLRRLAAGDSTLYLTTQKVATGEDGHPEVMGQPILELAGDLPVQPWLLGNLVPQQINLWAGCAPQGSSTGLHHDYHDNIYILLRGRKRFRLYPPSEAQRMYVRGELRAVHPNGRIVYKSQGDVLPDGSDASDVEQWRARRAAERELKAAEEAVGRGEQGATERLEAAEAALEAALDAALDGEAGDGWDDLQDDYEGSEGESEEEVGPAGAGRAAQDTGTAGDPDSFSRVDLSRPAAALRKEFPLFPGTSAAMVCDVHAGQMLFVPAGWFHEVSSFSTPGSPVHMALNYWVHPPDNLDPSPAGFAQPYRSEYWPDVWRGREHKYARGAPAAEGKAAGEPGGSTSAAAARGAAAAEKASCKRGREEAEPVPPGVKARLVQQLWGLFGIGRRQFLHRFVTVRRAAERE